MAKTILTKRQQALLKAIASEKKLQKDFYLSGGTALSEYYLHHRYSEDLDFFTEKEIESRDILPILEKIASNLKASKLDYEERFSRNLVFFHFGKEVIKTEFTYYPVEQIEIPKIIDGIKVDSLLDIAVNKTDTICQNPRSRDFVDLFLIIKKQGWNFSSLRKQARIKFDRYSDPIQVGKNLLLAKELKDYPRMIIKLNNNDWQDFWIKETEKLKKQAIV